MFPDERGGRHAFVEDASSLPLHGHMPLLASAQFSAIHGSVQIEQPVLDEAILVQGRLVPAHPCSAFGVEGGLAGGAQVDGNSFATWRWGSLRWLLSSASFVSLEPKVDELGRLSFNQIRLGPRNFLQRLD